MMQFSVLLSVYHKENPIFLRQSLDSVFAQTARADEVVLVKDGPLTEELEEVLDEYQTMCTELKIVSLPKNIGLGKALNEGLRHCTHDVVARMDTDDISKPDRFEKQLSVLTDHPEYDLVSSWIAEFSESFENIRSVRKLPEFPSQIYEYGKKRCPVNHPATMFRKSAVMSVGGYQHFPYLEDYYLWARMLVNGAKFYNIQESLLYFRTSDAVYKRRGGLTYALTEVRFMWELYRIGYISFLTAFLNSIVRFVVRIVPNTCRAWFYNKILRK